MEMEFLTQVNWFAVVLGGIFNMAFGSLWYGPLFGSLWLRMVGKQKDEINSSAMMYVLPGIASLIASYVLAALIAGLAITVWWHGLVLGAIVWFGIGSTATLTSGTFEGASRGAWFLFAVYQGIVYGVLGIVFTVW